MRSAAPPSRPRVAQAIQSFGALFAGGLTVLVAMLVLEFVIPGIEASVRESFERRPEPPARVTPQVPPIDPSGITGVQMPEYLIASRAVTPDSPVADFVKMLVAGGAGGYVAAHIAQRAHLLHGALAMWPLLLFGLASVLVSSRQAPWSYWLQVVATVVAGVIGGALRRRSDAGS